MQDKESKALSDNQSKTNVRLIMCTRERAICDQRSTVTMFTRKQNVTTFPSLFSQECLWPLTRGCTLLYLICPSYTRDDYMIQNVSLPDMLSLSSVSLPINTLTQQNNEPYARVISTPTTNRLYRGDRASTTRATRATTRLITGAEPCLNYLRCTYYLHVQCIHELSESIFIVKYLSGTLWCR